MNIINAKIKADWKITKYSPSGAALELYQFPDNFLDILLEKFSGDANTPLGGSRLSIKWGSSTAPVNVSQQTLGQTHTDFRKQFWPTIKYSTNAKDDPNDNPTNQPIGTTQVVYDDLLQATLVTKISGNYDISDNSLDNNGNPLHGGWITLTSQDIPELGLSELGTFRRLNSEELGWDYDNDGAYFGNPNVSTRALVLDRNGLPTTIFLQGDETLRIERIEKLFFHIPTNLSQSIDLVVESKQNVDSTTIDEHSLSKVTMNCEFNGQNLTPELSTNSAFFHLPPYQFMAMFDYKIMIFDDSDNPIRLITKEGWDTTSADLYYDTLENLWRPVESTDDYLVLMDLSDRSGVVNVSKVEIYLGGQIFSGAM